MIKFNKACIDSFGSFFETMSDYYSNNQMLSNELIKARADYFSLTGKLNESDTNFTNRINAFLLWFTFDWRCHETLRTPFEMYKNESNEAVNNADFIDQLETYERHIHSLFESIKLSNSHAVIRDLFTQAKFEITDPDFLYGSAKGTCFETRIFKVKDDYRFSNYFILHPSVVKKAIKKKCKQIHKKQESVKPFIITLHSYNTKWERYRNIDIRNIYHFDKSIPEAK
ncbi:hypothetical protein KJ966_10645 [bacterium]|nr:hypothetical protein [bacterium]